MVAESDQIMTIEQLAAYLKIARSMLYKLAKAGKLPGQKFSERWRLYKQAIDRWPGERAEKEKR